MANDVKVLKLITGEEVIARTNEGENNLVSLNKPMILRPVPGTSSGQIGFALVPWLMSAKDETIQISTKHILVEVEASNQVQKNYLEVVTGLSL